MFNLVRAAQRRGERPNNRRNPRAYTLGTGHVRFFYPRLRWLIERQQSIITEMHRRGYRVTFDQPWELAVGINPEWFGEWAVTPEALALNRQRLRERGG